MATATTPQQAGITAEQFAARPDPGYPEELVRGRIVRMSPPGARHGQICNRMARFLGNYAEEHDTGHALCNDSGVITERDPDSVLGADVSYYSYDRIPRGPLPVQYPAVAPELVVEVRSPSDRWPKVLAKVAEYLEAGVGVVCVLDDASRTARVFDAEGLVRILGEADELTFPELLPGFGVRVGRFFD